MATRTVSFSIDTEHDADLAAWLDKHSRRARSAAIREKLRAGLRQSDVSLADVLMEIREIKRLLRSGTMAIEPEGVQDDDPTAAAVKNKLAGLGL